MEERAELIEVDLDAGGDGVVDVLLNHEPSVNPGDGVFMGAEDNVAPLRGLKLSIVGGVAHLHHDRVIGAACSASMGVEKILIEFA